jgi:hypothetical protein
MDKTEQAQITKSTEIEATANGYVCTMCGNPITCEDKQTYSKSRRCCRCRYELDTDSGPIPVLAAQASGSPAESPGDLL